MSATYAGVLARAAAYGVRAARTREAVSRLQTRFSDRADSARYLSEGMTLLVVDAPTTTAYMEVATLSNAMAANVGGIVSSADALSVAAQGLDDETRGQHSRMADGNRSHDVEMAEPAFIQRR
ncbi:hypothetical protein AB0451_03240 [Streptomyces sp. NPDC052000]|uniref:hypothetical protein n=1 Tax=Streptomyces sp. NPDC052000 TaxID=3155676 RepID=UPI00345083CC